MTQSIEPTPRAQAAVEPARIESFAPITGELLGQVPITAPAEVHEVVTRARIAQRAWALLSVEDRAERLLRFRDALIERSDELIDLLSRETGKPRHEAMLQEVAVVADICSYYAEEAPALLKPEERPLHLFKHRRSFIEYHPRGVVGVIGPWNFPLQLPLRDALVALFAGNAAVIKPSEVTPLIMQKVKHVWDSCGIGNDLLGVIYGFAPTGVALLDSGIDMCVFTGSVATGRRVAAACGERLIPCVMELGGKAPLIACADCDIERTASAIVLGGFANSGQVCLSVERVYAHRDVHDALLARVVELTQQLRHGDPAKMFCDIGGMTFEKQIQVAEAHIADALSKGAELRCGGRRIADGKMAFEPTVLSGCNHDCTVMTEEIFGPIVPFMRVDSEQQAIQLANSSHLGLNAYVFTEDAVRGRSLASRIDAGGVLVNEVLINGGMADTPFGGIKHSGFGRVLGEEGLRAMCRVKHICVERVKMPAQNPIGFPYTDKSYSWMRKGLRALFQSGGPLKRLSELL